MFLTAILQIWGKNGKKRHAYTLLIQCLTVQFPRHLVFHQKHLYLLISYLWSITVRSRKEFKKAYFWKIKIGTEVSVIVFTFYVWLLQQLRNKNQLLLFRLYLLHYQIEIFHIRFLRMEEWWRFTGLLNPTNIIKLSDLIQTEFSKSLEFSVHTWKEVEIRNELTTDTSFRSIMYIPLGGITGDDLRYSAMNYWRVKSLSILICS